MKAHARPISRQGFGLVEVMVSLAIFGVLAVAMSSTMTTMFKASKTVDVKSQIQSFETISKLNLSSSEACKRALGIGTDYGAFVPQVSTVNMPTTVATPTPTPTPGATPTPTPTPTPGPPPVALAKIVLSGSTYSPGVKGVGTKIQDLYLSSLDLAITSLPPVATSTYYIGELRYGLTKNNPDSSMGASAVTKVQPMQISLKPDPSAPGKFMVADCIDQGTVDPIQSCSDMGGRWIHSKRFMSKDRCIQSTEINLNMNEYFDADEWVSPGQDTATFKDGVPDRGGANVRGERVESCKYQSGTTIAIYKCPGKSGNRPGDRCWYDTDLHRWQVNKFDSSGQPTGSKPKRICSAGVIITQNPSTQETLDFNEDLSVVYSNDPTDPLSLKYQNATPQSGIEANVLSSVSRCNYVPDQDSWFNCTNADLLNDALTGSRDSCLFLKNAKLYVDDLCASGGNCSYQTWFKQFFTGTADIAQICEPSSQPCGQTLSNYTGWARVYGAYRSTDPDDTTKGHKTTITEAQGLPCYQVEINKFASSPPLKAYPDKKTPIQSDWVSDPSKIRQCVVSALDHTSGNAGRQQFLPCTNDSSLMLGMTNPTTPTAIDMDNLLHWMGINTNTPGLKTNSCWYVENAKLAEYSGAGDVLTETHGTYTGWVRFNATIPQDRFRPRGGPLYRSKPSTSLVESTWHILPSWSGSSSVYLNSFGLIQNVNAAPDRTWQQAPLTNFNGNNLQNYAMVTQITGISGVAGIGFGQALSGGGTDWSYSYNKSIPSSPQAYYNCRASRVYTDNTTVSGAGTTPPGGCVTVYMPAVAIGTEAYSSNGNYTPITARACTGGILVDP